MVYMLEADRIQLLYFHLPPHCRNPWTWILTLALETPQVLMLQTVSYFVTFQLLCFHRCAEDFEEISGGIP
jgi:hypothetical protein